MWNKGLVFVIWDNFLVHFILIDFKQHNFCLYICIQKMDIWETGQESIFMTFLICNDLSSGLVLLCYYSKFLFRSFLGTTSQRERVIYANMSGTLIELYSRLWICLITLEIKSMCPETNYSFHAERVRIHNCCVLTVPSNSQVWVCKTPGISRLGTTVCTALPEAQSPSLRPQSAGFWGQTNSFKHYPLPPGADPSRLLCHPTGSLTWRTQ